MPDTRSLTKATPNRCKPAPTTSPDVRDLVTAHNGPWRPDESPEPHPRAYVQTAVEGATVRLSSPRKHSRKGGGLRSHIHGFSRQSRNRLLRMVGSINRKEFEPGQVLFVTLTYHRNWPDSPDEQYAQLRALHKRLQRRWGPLPLIWRKEWQSRGAPHFHLIVFTPLEAVPEDGGYWDFLDHLTGDWVDIVSRPGDSPRHMWIHGVDARICESWKATMAYASKHMRYISKEEQQLPVNSNGDLLPTGRIWGTLQRDKLPISWETTTITFKEYLQIRRYFRRLKRPKARRHRLRSIPKADLTDEWALVSYGEVNRLLAWLGYYRD
jgi:hypothetical protein